MENTDFTKNLVDYALKGEHTKIEIIKNYAQYRLAKEIGAAECKIAADFGSAEKQLIQDYIKNGDVKNLFEARTMRQCRDFYLTERNQTKAIIQEFREYLFSGTCIFIKIMLGADRTDE